MKKLLVLGAGNLQVPAIAKAKKMGLYVGVIDYDPSAIGIKYADEYFKVSTIDVQQVYNVSKSFRPNGIMTLASDLPIRSVAFACEKLGLPGISIETAYITTNKAEMIKAFSRQGVEHPWFITLNNIDDIHSKIDKITLPCICKPVDNSGSRGVILIKKLDELYDAVVYSAKHSRVGQVIIEEYLIGEEVSVEIIVVDGIPNVLAVTDKITTGAPYFVEMGHSQPSKFTGTALESIKDLACRAVKSVGLKNSPAHVEIMVTPNGPKMIELGARLGGDCITSHLVPFSTGIDIIMETIKLSLGEKPEIIPQYQKGSAIRYFNIPTGIIMNIDGIEEARKIVNIQEVTIFKQPGDRVDNITCSTDRAGYVISMANSAIEAIQACEDAINQVSFEIM